MGSVVLAIVTFCTVVVVWHTARLVIRAVMWLVRERRKQRTPTHQPGARVAP